VDGQQVVEVFPWNQAPQDLLRNRDGIDGAALQQRVRNSVGMPMRTHMEQGMSLLDNLLLIKIDI
jgi:hypothetical protein